MRGNAFVRPMPLALSEAETVAEREQWARRALC